MYTAKSLTESDWNHIIKSISKGFTEGEINSIDDEGFNLEGWWKLTDTGIQITLTNSI